MAGAGDRHNRGRAAPDVTSVSWLWRTRSSPAAHRWTPLRRWHGGSPCGFRVPSCPHGSHLTSPKVYREAASAGTCKKRETQILTTPPPTVCAYGRCPLRQARSEPHELRPTKLQLDARPSRRCRPRRQVWAAGTVFGQEADFDDPEVGHATGRLVIRQRHSHSRSVPQAPPRSAVGHPEHECLDLICIDFVLDCSYSEKHISVLERRPRPRNGSQSCCNARSLQIFCVVKMNDIKMLLKSS